MCLMSYTKKLGIIYTSLIVVAFFAYFAFAYYPYPVSKGSADVKGSAFSGPFSFLVPPIDSKDANVVHSPGSIAISYSLDGECNKESHFYYETILLDKGWELDSSSLGDAIDTRIYTKEDMKIQVSVSDKMVSDAGVVLEIDNCLVNLVGSSN